MLLYGGVSIIFTSSVVRACYIAGQIIAFHGRMPVAPETFDFLDLLTLRLIVQRKWIDLRGEPLPKRERCKSDLEMTTVTFAIKLLAYFQKEWNLRSTSRSSSREMQDSYGSHLDRHLLHPYSRTDNLSFHSQLVLSVLCIWREICFYVITNRP